MSVWYQHNKKSGAVHIELRPESHCRVLPPGELTFNSMIYEPLAAYSESFITITKSQSNNVKTF